MSAALSGMRQKCQSIKDMIKAVNSRDGLAMFEDISGLKMSSDTLDSIAFKMSQFAGDVVSGCDS